MRTLLVYLLWLTVMSQAWAAGGRVEDLGGLGIGGDAADKPTEEALVDDLYVDAGTAPASFWLGETGLVGDTPLTFEGAVIDDFEVLFSQTEPTASRTITVQDASGTLPLDDATAITNLDGVGLSVSAGALNFDATELGNLTWGSGATQTWTINAGAVDPTLAFTSGLVEINSGQSDVDVTLNGVNARGIFSVDASLDRINLSPSGGVRASSTSATWHAVLVDSDATITGSTAITTATGFNAITVDQPILTDNDAGTVAITNAATLYIADAPTPGGSTPPTITNSYALWLDAGTARFDGTIATALTASQCVQTDGSGNLTTSGGACGGGSDTNADKEFVWPMSSLLPLEAANSIPPIAKDAGTNLDLLPVDFDASTDECRTVSFITPPDITAGGTVTFLVTWYAASVTTNNVMWDFRHNSGVAEGVDPDQALTTEAAAADAVQGTAGQITVTSWTETQTNLAWDASNLVVGTVCRDANHASDTFAADARALTFSIRIPRS